MDEVIVYIIGIVNVLVSGTVNAAIVVLVGISGVVDVSEYFISGSVMFVLIYWFIDLLGIVSGEYFFVSGVVW